MATIVWIEKGKDSRWIAMAIAGAFDKACVIDERDFDDMNLGESKKFTLIERFSEILEKQGLSCVIVSPKHAISKFRRGLKVLPYGEWGVTSDDYIVHTPSDKVNERDLVIEKVLDYLKMKKLIKPLGRTA